MKKVLSIVTVMAFLMAASSVGARCPDGQRKVKLSGRIAGISDATKSFNLVDRNGGEPTWPPLASKHPHQPARARNGAGLVYQEVSCDPYLWIIRR